MARGVSRADSPAMGVRQAEVGRGISDVKRPAFSRHQQSSPKVSIPEPHPDAQELSRTSKMPVAKATSKTV